MLLTIRHDTNYRYAAPVLYSIQQLRLTPANGAAQLVRHWVVDAPGQLDVTRDAYGNTLHTLVLTKPHSEIHLSVAGEVETTPLDDGRLWDDAGPIPLEHYTCPTLLTEPDAAIHDLAHQLPSIDTPAALIALAERIADGIAYQQGVTEVTSPAAEALRLGKGVCQDHAHLMLACCRARGVPARYVSGYVEPGEVDRAASHAWVDVWLGDGWVSVDVTHARFASARYCRLAVGRDYEAAAPVRGSRVGGKEERLSVHVSVDSQADQ
ncbi:MULTISPECIES: transglutaminase family protein [unclassified Caballeronia]|uniref:transglutaminase family protein n=1 Tax=unclassified Caballeronia TaxID=2646786 RepID=UPI00285C585E|nr:MULTISPECIES: transglutaminase family protein [unclassified Caballeronia]MDR5754686.1 transglutaminase family protein [Caballeronia sp. LZ024]MDR5839812.1 transglutaminase family protein [Caballeronia sp. LZ031]